MVLAISISSSSVSMGGYTDGSLVFQTSMRADIRIQPDEYAVKIRSALSLHGFDCSVVHGAILCSVMPPMTPIIKQAVSRLFDVRLLTVGPGLKTGLRILTDDPAQLGADIVACSVAAISQYGAPLALCYLDDTASTIFYIDEKKCLRGGAIVPGVLLSLNALTAYTAQLPRIELDIPPSSPIGTNTIDCMKSGIIYGYAAMLDGMVDRFCKHSGTELPVISTGVMADIITPHCQRKIVFNSTLLLQGLAILYEKNSKQP